MGAYRRVLALLILVPGQEEEEARQAEEQQRPRTPLPQHPLPTLAPPYEGHILDSELR